MEKYKYSKKEQALMEHSSIPSAVYQFVDNQVVTLAVSKGFLDLFGIDDDIKSVYELLDNNMYRDCHHDDIALLEEAAIRFATKDEPYNIIYRSKIRGKYRIIHAFGNHIYKDSVKLALIWYVDEGEYNESYDFNINVMNAAYSNLLTSKDSENCLNYDYLSGLPTISYFFYLVETGLYEKTLSKKKTPVMLFCDLNGMRFFNAKYGFSEGDNLIRAFSRLLTETFTSQCCCRLGMDRFCVFTDETKLEERLWKFFCDCESINNGKSLSVRIGIYSDRIEKCSVSQACDRAKLACESSKDFPVSHFTYFDKSMLEKAKAKQYIIDNIDRAIKEKWIKVYYQPIIRAANGRVSDEEALARWIDPEKGFMNPSDFIPVLEDANLIYKLDLFMTEEVLEKMKEQDKNGLYVVPISVNLSRSDFHTCDIVNEIKKRVKNAGVPPEKLTIEITESVIGKDFEYMKTQIKRFQDSGFNVWMDDFGSGYSSLDVLHDIKFDLIKFDMKFMQQFFTNEKSKIILTGLMRTAMGLGIDTICEGVEKESQAEFLKEIGCTKLQGYYFCRPIPSEKVFERYEKGVQIGFENPDETEYYNVLGKVNLYDISSFANSDKMIFRNFFNTLPMSILEIFGNEMRIVRGNNTYREFLKKYFSILQTEKTISLEENPGKTSKCFLDTIRQSVKTDEPIIVDETLRDGTNIHVYIRRIAVNPVTDVTAIVTIILGIN